MIACAQCGKKNKDNATVCKYCGYNPGALQANSMQWGYQNGAYAPMQYQQPAQQGPKYYYDADGKAYKVQYDYTVTPVEDEEDFEDYGEGADEQQMTLYPYNPTLAQQQAQDKKEEAGQKNTMAMVAYMLAMFLDVLAWPFCVIGLFIARKRNGEGKELCIGGMLFTLMRILSVAILYLVWYGVSKYLPNFFVGGKEWKIAVAKIVLFGWPVAIGSIFNETAPEGSAFKVAGKGYFLFSLAVAVLGILFFDMAWLPLFS